MSVVLQDVATVIAANIVNAILNRFFIFLNFGFSSKQNAKIAKILYDEAF